MHSTSHNQAQDRIFDERRRGVPRGVVLPWKRTVEVCWANIRHRMGRCVLTFLCIAVVVAFFASSVTAQLIQGDLMRGADVHVQAVLERAGVFTHDAGSLQRQRDERLWLMSLSAFLCLVGITNTILMSVTERIREIGTLKCLGALDSFVVRLFLVEAVFIGALGSVLGGALGCILGILQTGAVLEFSVLSVAGCLRAGGEGLLLAVGLGTLLTTLAAVYPTYVAAKMKPVEAMRVEV
jgi:putative ABC transport system permease protein